MHEKPPIIKYIEDKILHNQYQQVFFQNITNTNITSITSPRHSLKEKYPANVDDFFTTIVQNHSDLITMYYALRRKIMLQILNYNQAINDELLADTQAAFEVSIILEEAIQDYIGEPYDNHVVIISQDNIGRLRQDQRIFKSFLEQENYSFVNYCERQSASGETVDRLWRDAIFLINSFRLLIIRSRTLILRIGVLFHNLDNYGLFFAASSTLVSAIFFYIGWLFFIPRLSVNLTFLLLHTIVGVTEQESKIDWTIRFQLQWYRRGIEISNDVAWLIGGLLCCFVYASSAASLGYILIAMQSLDLLRTGICAAYEWHRLSSLYNAYEQQKENASEDEKKSITTYQESLQERMQLEYSVIRLSLMNFSVLIIGSGLMLSLAAINPVLPILGALIALLMVFVQWYCLDKLRNDRENKYFAQIKYPDSTETPSQANQDSASGPTIFSASK